MGFVMGKVFLVNPSNVTPGYSFITPRWLFVLAGATPVDLVGDPILTDESLARFDPKQVSPGDIVGIGITSGNCLPGYRVSRQAKERGATVVFGGIHATIFPEEPLRMGADSVVTGNGELIWRNVVEDALAGRLRRRYDGGRVPGEALGKARWDLLDPSKYMMASIQTVAGCPENCSFCSVWVTDGRKPRQRLAEKVIEEANELYRMGFRYIVFADDNFNPATRARIAREPSPQLRRSLETIREDRLRFFEEYHRSVPDNLYAFTQMTAEIVDDEEYLRGMRDHMRIRTALVGVESFDEEGLEAANKQWNPAGQKDGQYHPGNPETGHSGAGLLHLRTRIGFGELAAGDAAPRAGIGCGPGAVHLLFSIAGDEGLSRAGKGPGANRTARLRAQAQDADHAGRVLAAPGPTGGHRGTGGREQGGVAARARGLLEGLLFAAGDLPEDVPRRQQIPGRRRAKSPICSSPLAFCRIYADTALRRIP